MSLNAYHESGSIVIEVADDGGGLDAGASCKKPSKRAGGGGCQSHPGRHLPADPGTGLFHCRGGDQPVRPWVGMDVVKSNVEALRGTLDIESTPGQGTTMRICLPLTLAIIDGFQVGVGHSTFILPLDSVVECIELPPGSDAADYLNLRGEVLPFLRLRRLFAVAGEAPVRQNIVVVRFFRPQGRHCGGPAVWRVSGGDQTAGLPVCRRQRHFRLDHSRQWRGGADSGCGAVGQRRCRGGQRPADAAVY